MATEEATTKPRRTRTAKAKETETKAQTDSDLTEYKDDKGKQLTVQQLKNKLRGQAERAVLDKYKKEVISHTEALYKEHNLEYVRRLSDEEKAEQEVARLLALHPNLRSTFTAKALQEASPGDIAEAAGHLRQKTGYESSTMANPRVEVVDEDLDAARYAAEHGVPLSSVEVEQREGE